MRVIGFHCPTCKEVTEIEEVMIDAVTYQTVESFSFDENDEDCDYIDGQYGKITSEEGEVIKYACQQCGEKICDGDSSNLIDKVKSNPELFVFD